MLNYTGGRGRGQIALFTPIAFNNEPPPPIDYEICKEHLPTHLTFTPSLHDFQSSIPSVIFLVLHFYWATLQNSTKIVIECQHSIKECTASNWMCSNVPFSPWKLLRSGKCKKKKKVHRKLFFPRERPVLYSKFEHAPSPQFPPTHFTNKIIACPKGHFTVTTLPLTLRILCWPPLLINPLPPLKLSTKEHSTRTKLCHLAHGRPEGKPSNPWGNKRKSWTHLPSSFPLSIPEL